MTYSTQLVSQSLENTGSTKDFSTAGLGPAGVPECRSLLLWPTVGAALRLTLLVPVTTPERTASQDVSLVVPFAAYSFINNWPSGVYGDPLQTVNLCCSVQFLSFISITIWLQRDGVGVGCMEAETSAQ